MGKIQKRAFEEAVRDAVESRLDELHQVVLDLEDARKRLEAITAYGKAQQAEVHRLTAKAEVALTSVNAAIAAAYRTQHGGGPAARTSGVAVAKHDNETLH